MSYAVGTIVQNTRTGEYGIITTSGGFSPLPAGTQPYSSAVPRIYFPPASAGTVDTTPKNSQPNVWGGIDPMGAGIAGINTPSRKLGQANNPGQQTTTSGGIEVTKAQKRDARNIRNEFDLKEGDYIWRYKTQERCTGPKWWKLEANGMTLLQYRYRRQSQPWWRRHQRSVCTMM